MLDSALNLDITFPMTYYTVGLPDCFEGRDTVKFIRLQLYTLL